MYLMNYNFEIKHACGTSGVISKADGISRREYAPEADKDIEEEFQDQLISTWRSSGRKPHWKKKKFTKHS